MSLALANSQIAKYTAALVELSNRMAPLEAEIMAAAGGKNADALQETQKELNLLKQLFRMVSDFLSQWKDIAKAFLEKLKEFNEFLSGR